MANLKLYRLLSALNAADEATESELELDFEQIVAELGESIDKYHYVLKKLEAEERFIDDEIKVLLKKRNTIRNNINSFKKNIKNAMVFNGASKLPGEKWKLRLKPKSFVKIVEDANKDLFNAYPNLIRAKTTFEWKKKELKKALVENEELQKFASNCQDYDIVFDRKVKK